MSKADGDASLGHEQDAEEVAIGVDEAVPCVFMLLGRHCVFDAGIVFVPEVSPELVVGRAIDGDDGEGGHGGFSGIVRWNIEGGVIVLCATNVRTIRSLFTDDVLASYTL